MIAEPSPSKQCYCPIAELAKDGSCSKCYGINPKEPTKKRGRK